MVRTNKDQKRDPDTGTDISNFTAGELAENISQWRKLRNDPWVVETVTGYHLEFDHTPVETSETTAFR